MLLRNNTNLASNLDYYNRASFSSTRRFLKQQVGFQTGRLIANRVAYNQEGGLWTSAFNLRPCYPGALDLALSVSWIHHHPVDDGSIIQHAFFG